MISPASRTRGIPSIAVAMNVLGALWVVLAVIGGLNLWPDDGGYGAKTKPADLAPAISVMFLGGVAATVAFGAAAVVAQVAKRGDADAS
ncbi:hypothetical protein [Dactylosporangium salmoneum]|uniref:Uncharacterized protein n=1 Tax=Dactylosporangium salmoneum TaxID=53361 RepID=A0ABN3G9W5_9ACTN